MTIGDKLSKLRKYNCSDLPFVGKRNHQALFISRRVLQNEQDNDSMIRR